MKLYFYGPTTSKQDLAADYEVIRKALKRGDVWLSSNLERQPVNLPPEVIERAQELDQPLLDQMDALVINGTESDEHAGYLVAYAITTKKPMLFLYTRGVVPQLFKHLTAKAIPRWIEVVAYTDKNLEPTVERFLGGLTGVKIKEVPRIKFTLRITRSIERFLTFKTHNTKLTKADWLREEIEKKMESDEDWEKFNREEWEQGHKGKQDE